MLLYIPPKSFNDSELIYNDNDEGKIRMVHEAVKHRPVKGDTLLIMGISILS